MRRLDVEFLSGGQTCRAWLYLPSGSSPRPVVVMAHGLGGVRQMRLDAFAERFATAGYACLVFDYRHFGASDGTPRQLLDIRRQAEDWHAAIRFARTCSSVDGSHVVLWGTSFGGGHVLVAAAEDQQVVAVIAQCPFTDGATSALATHRLSSLKVTALGLLDQLGSWFGRAPILVATAGTPGSAALMSAADCVPGYLQLVPPGAPFENRVAARFALQIIRSFPGRRAADIRCPVLFCVCEHDSVAPAPATIKHARKARRGEVKTYPVGHFDIYVGGAFERAIVDQIDFLNRHVPGI